MGLGPQAKRRAVEEAARWFTRLNSASISTAELAEFRLWRRQPLHDTAFKEIEGVWGQSAALKDDPALQAALDDARSRSRRRPTPRWRSAPGLAAGLGAVAIASLALILVLRQASSAGDTYATKLGERRAVTLADGSRVSLDTQSRIVVRYSPGQRLVMLAGGQALFEVVHRPDRPFLVEAGETRIRDLGTRFDVRREDGHALVTVVEGSVTVDVGKSHPALTLVAGQQILSGRTANAPYPVDPLKATSWTSGRLIFEETPLAVATSEMNRYGEHRVILSADKVAAIKVSGAFNSADTAAFVTAVTRLLDLTAQTQPDGSIVLSPNRDPGAVIK